MTESDWITATDPQEMLLFLRNSGKASERKLRLFAVACCRRVWRLVPDAGERRLVESAERYADGLARAEATGAADRATRCKALPRRRPPTTGLEAARPGRRLDAEAIALAGRRPPGRSRRVGYLAGDPRAAAVTDCEDRLAERRPRPHERRVARSGTSIQAALLRDIFGPLPFRPVTLPPSVRTWNDGTIPKLAEAAYQERALPSGELDRERLAVLADALEEVGADALLLEHLTGAGAACAWGLGRRSAHGQGVRDAMTEERVGHLRPSRTGCSSSCGKEAAGDAHRFCDGPGSSDPAGG